MKMLSAALAAAVALTAVGATAAQAAPHHRHKVCTVSRSHHHSVRRCYYR